MSVFRFCVYVDKCVQGGVCVRVYSVCVCANDFQVCVCVGECVQVCVGVCSEVCVYKCVHFVYLCVDECVQGWVGVNFCVLLMCVYVDEYIQVCMCR